MLGETFIKDSFRSGVVKGGGAIHLIRMGSGCVAPETLVSVYHEGTDELVKKPINEVNTFLVDVNDDDLENGPLQISKDPYDLLKTPDGTKIVPIVPVWIENILSPVPAMARPVAVTFGDLPTIEPSFKCTSITLDTGEIISTGDLVYEMTFENISEKLIVSKEHPFLYLNDKNYIIKSDPIVLVDRFKFWPSMRVKAAAQLEVGDVVGSPINSDRAARIENIKVLKGYSKGIYNLIVASTEYLDQVKRFSSYAALRKKVVDGSFLGLNAFTCLFQTGSVYTGALNLQLMFDPCALDDLTYYEQQPIVDPGNY